MKSYPDIKLLPCPFCGCRPKFFQQHSPVGSGRYPFRGVDTLVQCVSRRCDVKPSTGTFKMATAYQSSGDYALEWRRCAKFVAKVWNKRIEPSYGTNRRNNRRRN